MSTNPNTSRLANRLTRHLAAGAAVVAAAPFMTVDQASAAVQYNAVSMVVPANIDGLYINVETLATGSAAGSVAGWDINPYSATGLTWFMATGSSMMRYPGVITGSAGNLAIGTMVDATGSYGSGAVTVGAAPGNWVLNSDNHFGFKFVAADGLTHYGWGTFHIGAAINGADRTITELAWETSADVGITVGDTGAGSGPYDPCAATNPSISVGNNTLFMRTTDIADFSGACGTIYKANYYKFTAPATRNYDFSTCTGGSATSVAVLDGCAPGSAILDCGSACGASGARATLSAVAGGVYYVVVGSSVAGVDLPTPYGVTCTPWYDSCDAANPTVGNGNSNLAYNNTTAENLSVGGAGCSFTIYQANYYMYTPSVSGEYTFSTCNSGADTRIAIVDGCAAGAGVLACNDNYCGSSSSVTLELVGTLPVYFVVGSGSAKSSLASTVAVTVAPPPLPACVDAVAAVFGDNPFDNTGSTTAQTARSSADGLGTGTINKSVWYTFVPHATGAYSFSFCGASGDTIVAIGDMCPGVGARFESLAYNDDAPCASGVTLRSFIDATNNGATGTYAGFPLTQDLVAGQTYYLCAGSFSSTTNITGTFTIDGPPMSQCPADLNGDTTVDSQDLAILLGNWGGAGVGDINGDGTVDSQDLAVMLGAWGPCQ